MNAKQLTLKDLDIKDELIFIKYYVKKIGLFISHSDAGSYLFWILVSIILVVSDIF